MGFRCTIVSYDCSGKLPEWFEKKYSKCHEFQIKRWYKRDSRNSVLISSKRERKYYSDEFFKDYQKALCEVGFYDKINIPMIIAVLGEDGCITKVKIWENEIKYFIMGEEQEHHQIPSYWGDI